MELGNRIKEARINRQLTQKDVVGDYMTRNMLSKIENGSAVPSVKTLEYLAGALSMPASYFLDEGTAPPAANISECLAEISRLADEIMSKNDNDTYTLALCIKEELCKAQNDYKGAYEYACRRMEL